MPLKLFYITNNPEVALIAEKYGVDRIWIDLEVIGKEERQRYINSVKSNHQISDIETIKPLLTEAEMLVRVNPWHEDSENEVNAVVTAGADIIMLPMWKSVDEVEAFLKAVNGRTKTMLLLETKESVDCVDEVLKLNFDEIHIGLNDLHLSYGMSFMFEPLADGTVEALCEKFKQVGIPYGFGGIARLGKGMLPAEKVIMEHYRLGSSMAILSRSFCDINHCDDLGEIEERFKANLKPLRAYETTCAQVDAQTYEDNRQDVVTCVNTIVEKIGQEKKGHGGY